MFCFGIIHTRGLLLLSLLMYCNTNCLGMDFCCGLITCRTITKYGSHIMCFCTRRYSFVVSLSTLVLLQPPFHKIIKSNLKQCQQILKTAHVCFHLCSHFILFYSFHYCFTKHSWIIWKHGNMKQDAKCIINMMWMTKKEDVNTKFCNLTGPISSKFFFYFVTQIKVITCFY